MNKKILSLSSLLGGFAVATALLVPTHIIDANAPQPSELDQVTGVVNQNLATHKKYQDEITQLTEKLQNMRDKNREVIRAQQIAKENIASLKEVIADEEARIVDLRKDIESSEQIAGNISALLPEMNKDLQDFIASDLPFSDLQRARVTKDLNEAIANPELSLPAKMRKVFEAYLTELSYGTTAETYDDEIQVDGRAREAKILRVGRLSLVAVSKERDWLGAWDRKAQRWSSLPNSYKDGVLKAMATAEQKATDDLLAVPLIPQTTAH